MNWNDAAEDLLQQILAQTPRPLREGAEAQLRERAESLADDDGKRRVGVETVIAAWIATTPEAVRSDLPSTRTCSSKSGAQAPRGLKPAPHFLLRSASREARPGPKISTIRNPTRNVYGAAA